VTPAQPRIPVLVLAKEQVVAALVGMLVESDRFEPIFAQPGERVEDAITRSRAALIILLDGEMDLAGSDLFFTKAAKARARVILFSAPHSRRPTYAEAAGIDIASVARQRGIPYLPLPTDHASLRQCLSEVAETM
jgi:hypothetical protein